MSVPVSRDRVVEIVSAILAERNRQVEVNAQTRLDTLELESLDFMELFAQLEELSGSEFNPEMVDRIETVGDLTMLGDDHWNVHGPTQARAGA
jgi:acyl carrier protein